MSVFDEKGVWSKMRRCTLLDNGLVNYYLDSNDSTKKEDGTVADLTGNDGQVMVEIPKFWYRKTSDSEIAKFEVSDSSREGMSIHPAFYRDRDGDGIAEEVDFRYYSAYLGYSSGGKLLARRGVRPTVSQTIGSFRNLAEARGNGWGLLDYNLLYAVQLLYITEYGHPDSQTTIGRGYVDGNSSSRTTGGTTQYGNKTFGETTGKQQMSYRGIEDLWGNCYYWIDGINSDSNFNILIGNKSFNNAGTGYASHATGNASSISGYIGQELSMVSL